MTGKAPRGATNGQADRRGVPPVRPLPPLAFAERFVRLRGRRIAFDGRPYLPAIYNSAARRLVLRASRQIEKTTLLVNLLCHAAVTRPGIRILCVFPRWDQASVFSRSRLIPTIMESPVLCRALLGRNPHRPAVRHLQFRNGSEVYVRAAYHTADAARGVDADLLLVDEVQGVAPGDLPVLEEALSHSEVRRVVLTGTPKLIENPIEAVFAQSTAHEWRVPCTGCGEEVRLDGNCLGANGPWCPQCHTGVDPTAGRWVARNPDAVWGDGFWVNHVMVPWMDYAELLNRQATYDPALFANECLGLPTTLGDHLVTRAEVEACCQSRAMARRRSDVPATFRDRLLAGVDWGGGGTSQTVLAIGYLRDDNHLVVLHLQRFRPQEQPDAVLEGVARVCHEFQVAFAAADAGGNGSVYNALLLEKLPRLKALYGVYYSAADQPPRQRQGRLWDWTVGRTPSLGMVFSRIKKGMLLFPRAADCGGCLDEIARETAEYDAERRTIRYTHPNGQADDALHAMNYLTVMAQRWLEGRYASSHRLPR